MNRFRRYLNEWGDTFPWLQDLEETPQDPEWHAEGNVAVHTDMCLKALESWRQEHEPDWLDEGAYRRLWDAVACHDIGKAVTTTERTRDGETRVVAPRHPERGRTHLAYRIFERERSYCSHHRLLNLIGRHHRPKHIVMDNDPPRVYQRLARKVSLRELAVLCLVDMQGRECSDRQDQIDRIRLFQLMARDHDLFDHPLALYRDWGTTIRKTMLQVTPRARERALVSGMAAFERGEIRSVHEAIARARNKPDDPTRAIVLCGPSGTGKSAWVNTTCEDMDCVSMDTLRDTLAGSVTDQSENGRVYQQAKRQWKEALRSDQDVVWDATGLTRQQRGKPLQMGFDYDAHVTLVWFHDDRSSVLERFQARRRQATGRKRPQGLAANHMEALEVPYLTEAHRVMHVRPDPSNPTQWDTLFDSRDWYQRHVGDIV